MGTKDNKDKPAQCESILHCKATAALNAAVKAELEEDDKPLKELLADEDEK